MYTIAATYKGLAPMMHDRFFNPEETDRGRAKKRAATTWRDELPLKLHADANGVFLPADNIRMMLIGNQYRPGAAAILGAFIESKKKTEYLSMCKGCIWVLGRLDPLKVYLRNENDQIIQWNPDDYDERSFPAKGGGRKLTRRPIIRLPWYLPFLIQVTDDRIDPNKVRELFDVAGFRCGAGAYGPTFGRCLIVEWRPDQLTCADPIIPTMNSTGAEKLRREPKAPDQNSNGTDAN